MVILATGSEVSLAVETKEKLQAHKINARVVSIPSFELFNQQSDAYKKQILGGENVLKVAIEAGIAQGWHQFIGANGIFIGMNSFGASGKAEDLFKHFGITADVACEKIVARLGK